jgi:methionyl-tRNA formyltransferase
MEKVKVLLLGDNPVAKYALELIVNNYDVLVITDETKEPWLPKDFKPDVAFSIKYPHILSKEFIKKVGVPILNFHTAPLPELRGVDTCSWAIFHKLKRFGVTVHIINDKVDDGPIVLKETFPIEPYDTAYSLYCKNLILLKKIIRENIVRFVEGKYTTRRIKSKVSYIHKRGEFDYTKLKVPEKDQDIFIRSRFFPGKQLPYYE